MAITTVQITDKVIAPDGTGVTSGTIEWTLSAPGNIPDGAAKQSIPGGKFSGPAYKITLDEGGVMPASAKVAPNDLITPDGTYWTVKCTCYTPASTNPITWTEKLQLSSGSASISFGAIPRVEVPAGAGVTALSNALATETTARLAGDVALNDQLASEIASIRSDYGGTPGTILDAWTVQPTGASASSPLKDLFKRIGYSVKDFGAVGDGTTDDTASIVAATTAATSSKVPLRWPAGTYKVTSPLTLSGCSHVGEGPEYTLVHWYGAGTCITWSGGASGRIFKGIGIVGKGGQGSGQNGFLCNGYEGPVVEQVTVLDVDGVGFRIGNTPGGAGVYFGHFNYIRCLNSTVNGVEAFRVDGAGGANSNSNHIRNAFTKGKWARHYAVLGNANVFAGCDAEPNNSAYAVNEVLYFEGIGNVWLGLYLEPVGATLPTLLCKFTSTAQSNRIHHVYAPPGGATVDARVSDDGTNNEIVFNPTGYNFAARGRNQSSFNHIPNAEFRLVAKSGANDVPAGWAVGAGTYTREAGYRSKYCMRVDVSSQQGQLNCYIATNNPAVRNSLGTPTPVGAFKDRTMWVGAWVKSSTTGLGCVRINGVGVQVNSGAGNWEFLVACVRIPAGVTEVPFQVINNGANSAATGTYWIEHPIAVIGNDLPTFAPKPLTDGAAYMAGPFVRAPHVYPASGTATPDVSDTNIIRPTNLAATNITNFVNGTAGQEIEVVCASTGTVTCASVLAGDTVTLAGVVLTAVSGAPGTNQFTIDGGDTACATDLARCINAVSNGIGAFGYGGTSLKNLVSASAAANVVSITCSRGELFGLVSSNGTRLAVTPTAGVMDSQTTFVHANNQLMLTGASNKLAIAGKVYRFTNDGFKWREVVSPHGFVPVPASATAYGRAGQWSADASYLYVCHADNTWKRVAIATW